MKNKGFSLIEASIALIIVGLLMAPVIAEYHDHMNVLRRNITAANTFAVKSAIEAYYVNNGRYPCPAALNKKLGDPGYGGEPVDELATSCIPPGLALNTCEDGVCLAEAASPLDSPILYGGVPFAELQMNEDKTFDGWDNKITYVVSADMTRRGPTAFFPSEGSIVVQLINSEVLVTKPEKANYLVISHGDNGKGAFNKDGINRDAFIDDNTSKMLTPCEPGIDYDSMNCDNDGVYLVTRERATSEGNARYYDDRIMDVYTTPSTAWNPALNPKSVTTGLAVGIGTQQVGITLLPNGDPKLDAIGQPTQYAHTIGLDVMDSIRADTLKSDEICTVDGENCFSPQVLAGSGIIDCKSKQAAMTGIAENKAKCSDKLKINTTPKACTMVIGVQNGVIQCAP